MDRDDSVMALYPPHPEEGANTCISAKRKRREAPVSKDGAARARLCQLRRPEIPAPHHEAERDRVCIKLIGDQLSAAIPIGTSNSPH